VTPHAAKHQHFMLDAGFNIAFVGGFERQTHQVFIAGFGQHVVDVVVDGAGTNAKRGGHLFAGVVGAKESQNFQLTRGEGTLPGAKAWLTLYLGKVP
jgi:VanZ family protein